MIDHTVILFLNSKLFHKDATNACAILYKVTFKAAVLTVEGNII